MVGVDADLLTPEVKSIVAVLDRLQLMVRRKLGVTPQPAVDDVRQSFLLRYLQALNRFLKKL